MEKSCYEEIRIQDSEWKGRKYIDVRVYYEDRYGIGLYRSVPGQEGRKFARAGSGGWTTSADRM